MSLYYNRQASTSNSGHCTYVRIVVVLGLVNDWQAHSSSSRRQAAADSPWCGAATGTTENAGVARCPRARAVGPFLPESPSPSADGEQGSISSSISSSSQCATASSLRAGERDPNTGRLHPSIQGRLSVPSHRLSLLFLPSHIVYDVAARAGWLVGLVWFGLAGLFVTHLW
jgi:hypothetical protein